MSKPMLIEALKPGMRAKLGNGEEVWRTENYIRSKTITKISNVTYLTSTDYEIIPDEPKPWTPTKGHGGFAVMPYMGEIELLPGNSDHWTFALKTMEAAKQKAKLDRIVTAILNMPGYGEFGKAVVWCGVDKKFQVWNEAMTPLDFTFDTEEHAYAAADYANKLMEASHA
jgi:hypothetical protein